MTHKTQHTRARAMCAQAYCRVSVFFAAGARHLEIPEEGGGEEATTTTS